MRVLFFFVGCVIVLIVFALVWPYVAPGYVATQIFFVRPLIADDLRFQIEPDGITVYEHERYLARRDFLSFGGLGLTLALWLFTPGLRLRRRLTCGVLALGMLFFFHIAALWGLIAFAQAVARGQGGGLPTLLYSIIALGDWIVPFLLWGAVLLSYRLSGAIP